MVAFNLSISKKLNQYPLNLIIFQSQASLHIFQLSIKLLVYTKSPRMNSPASPPGVAITYSVFLPSKHEKGVLAILANVSSRGFPINYASSSFVNPETPFLS